MKIFRYLFTCIIFMTSAAMAASDAECKTAQNKSVNSIPIVITGKTLEIRKGITRADIKSLMPAIVTDEATVDISERLQYDVILAEGQAPATMYFDFDEKGIVTKVMLDSYEAAQNPPVTALLKWLEANAGKPKLNKKKGTKTWIFSGWKIEHTNHGSGEDSVYSIELTLQK